VRTTSMFATLVASGTIVAGAASAQGVAAGGGGVAAGGVGVSGGVVAGGGGIAGGGVAVGGRAQFPAGTPLTSPSGAPLTWIDPSQPPPGAASDDNANRFSTPSAAPASTAGVDAAATAPDTWADVTAGDRRPRPVLHDPGSARFHGARRHAKTSSKRAAISRHERRSARAS
jgi:hypothetical protein